MVTPLQLDSKAPWRQRFHCNTLGYTYVAPENGARGIVHANLDGPEKRLYAWDTNSNTLNPLTAAEGSPSYGWLGPTGDYLYYLQDDQGNEIGHLVRVPYDGGPPVDLTPDLPFYTLRGFDISRSGNCLAFDAVYGNQYWYYCLDIDSNGSFSGPRLVFSAREETWGCYLSSDGKLLAVKSTKRAPRSRRYAALVFDAETGEQVSELWDGAAQSVEPIQFSPVAGDARLLATTTADGYVQPLLWDVRTGERTNLHIPQSSGDIVPLDWSSDGGKLLVQTETTEDKNGLYVLDLVNNGLSRLNHEPGTFRGRAGTFHTGTVATYFAPEGTVWAQWSDASCPVRLLSLTSEDPPKPVLPVPDCPPGRPWQSVEFPSSDGVSIQAWLGIPGTPEGIGAPYPTILHVHGGPTGAVSNSFDALGQAWLDHGFAYLSVNYRGSTTFGREFQDKINGDVGHWELEDMLAARRWLIQEGISAPDGIVLEGGSYGGFLTAWALSQAPNEWAGGMAPVAIVDWTMNYADSSDAMKGWAQMLFGGTPQEKPELYRDRSPLTHASAITAPLLIFQGKHDSRATPRQMQRFAAQMEEMDKDFTLVWLDRGHGFGDSATAERIQEAHLRFAYRALGLNGPDVE